MQTRFKIIDRLGETDLDFNYNPKTTKVRFTPLANIRALGLTEAQNDEAYLKCIQAINARFYLYGLDPSKEKETTETDHQIIAHIAFKRCFETLTLMNKIRPCSYVKTLLEKAKEDHMERLNT